MHDNLMIISLETCALFTPSDCRYICYVSCVDCVEKIVRNPEPLLNLLRAVTPDEVRKYEAMNEQQINNAVRGNVSGESSETDDLFYRWDKDICTV